MSKIKKFIGEYAYKYIKNMAYDADALRKALVTPANARAVFSELSEYEIKSLVSDISNSGTIGTVRNTTQEEIKEAFAKGGYTTVIFDDEQAIAECKKYYREDEVICTYNNLRERMREYHMLVAIKDNIDEIKRSDKPERDDEYGTSILNIQIARNGSHMSIKNRYNHTVSQCDNTLNNDLNHITMGLQSMVLGYYGFAGLTKANNRYYKNVVNIGGIYLKYHTEINNIYFGDFVLDGVNGARFTDAGRYYITNGHNGYYRDRFPMVLDFKNKVAIDLIGNNGKIPLVTRALKEGLLHSGNKEQAETLNAVFPEAKKELLKANKKALKYIAEVHGYDFQKPYKVTGILGKFTAKSIEKITGSNNALLLIADGNQLYAAKLNYGEFQVKDINGRYEYDIDYFYSQGDFENKRKSGDRALYVIQQDKQYIRTIKEKQGRKWVYFNNRMRYFDEMSDTELAQYKLMKRLETFKANKRKAEVQATDYTTTVKVIEKDFAALKSEIVSRLINAITYEDYRILSEVINYRLQYLVRDIEDFKNRAVTKDFISNEQAQNLINDINLAIAKSWECLNKTYFASANAQKIADFLNKNKYKLSDGEKWYVYDYDFMQDFYVKKWKHQD